MFDVARQLLVSRRNVSARRLVEPGPDAAQLTELLHLAASAPDHGLLTPWRFIEIPSDKRHLLAEVFALALVDRDAHATIEQIEAAGEKAHRAPLLLIAVACLGERQPNIPRLERMVSMGAAIQNILLGAQAMGFGAGLTSGKAMFSDCQSVRRLRCASSCWVDDVDLRAGGAQRLCNSVYRMRFWLSFAETQTFWREFMSLPHALLSALMERPCSGSELAIRFDRSIGYFWHATHQQIYRELNRLETAHWIESLPEEEGRGKKRAYRILPAGRKELKRWVAEYEDPSPVRSELLVRLRAEAVVGPTGLAEQVKRRLALHQEKLDLYRRIEARDFAGRDDSPETALQHLVLKAGFLHESMWIEISKEALKILALKARRKTTSKGAD